MLSLLDEPLPTLCVWDKKEKPKKAHRIFDFTENGIITGRYCYPCERLYANPDYARQRERQQRARHAQARKQAQAAFKPIGGLPTHLPPYTRLKCPFCANTHELGRDSERRGGQDCPAGYSMYHGWEIFLPKYGYLRPIKGGAFWNNHNGMSEGKPQVQKSRKNLPAFLEKTNA